VIKQGKIVEQGSHDELMQTENGVYFRLWNKQLKDRLKIKSKIKRISRTVSVRSRKSIRRSNGTASDSITVKVEEDLTPQTMTSIPVGGAMDESVVGKDVSPQTMTSIHIRDGVNESVVGEDVTPQTMTTIHVGDVVNESVIEDPQTMK